MTARVLLACLIAIGSATPAFARKYYVVQNTKTLKCSVLPKKPKGKTVVLVARLTRRATRRGRRFEPRALAKYRVSRKKKNPAGGKRGSPTDGGGRAACIA